MWYHMCLNAFFNSTIMKAIFALSYLNIKCALLGGFKRPSFQIPLYGLSVYICCLRLMVYHSLFIQCEVHLKTSEQFLFHFTLFCFILIFLRTLSLHRRGVNLSYHKNKIIKNDFFFFFFLLLLLLSPARNNFKSLGMIPLPTSTFVHSQWENFFHLGQWSKRIL